MNKRKRTIVIGGETVEVTWKKIRSIRLRVDRYGRFAASAPYFAPWFQVEAFLRGQEDWIRKQAAQMRQSRERSPREVADGAQRMILGEKVTVRIVPSGKKKVIRDGNEIWIMTPETDDPAALEKAYDAYYRKTAAAFLKQLTVYYDGIVEGGTACPPTVSLRKMTTRWGSCTPQKRTIRYNYYLFEAPRACVEYVVLHEVTHLIHPDHGVGFYAQISAVMPDYRERKRLLEKSVRINE